MDSVRKTRSMTLRLPLGRAHASVAGCDVGAGLRSGPLWAAGRDGTVPARPAWQGRRLVLNYNHKHAARTKRCREEELLKAEGAIRSGNILRSRCLRIANNRAVLDLERFAADEILDGIQGVWTSLQNADQVRSLYGALSQIERGFRVLKHELAARSASHWTARRARAHVAI